MKRAVARNAEQLDKERLIKDYNTYYYPAQHLHFMKDQPEKIADIIFEND
jgi:uridine kinase